MPFGDLLLAFVRRFGYRELETVTYPTGQRPEGRYNRSMVGGPLQQVNGRRAVTTGQRPEGRYNPPPEMENDAQPQRTTLWVWSFGRDPALVAGDRAVLLQGPLSNPACAQPDLTEGCPSSSPADPST